MGLVRAVAGAIGGTFADQWVDFYTVPDGVQDTSALFPAVLKGTNAGRGSNTRHSSNIITNGSKIIVPEGYALLTFQDGAITSFSEEAGAYIWDSEDVNSQSIFTGGGFAQGLIKQSWERFKFGGIPGSQQIALFVNLKELPNNRFGTQSEIYWDDAYLNTQVGAKTRGSYTLRIVDPIVFAKTFVPATVLQNGQIFDFTDPDNNQANQLFTEVVSSLASAFSLYTNNPEHRNRISSIQQDSVGFAKSLSEAVEKDYEWRTTRGLEIVKVAIVAVEYDEATKELVKTVQRADALSGSRGNVNLQASVAEGIQSAGATEGASGILGLGIAAGSIGLSDLRQTPGATPSSEGESGQPSSSLVARLTELKESFELGLITEEEYQATKRAILID